MAYITKELFDKALIAIEEHKLFFIEDIIAFLPCAKPTFYEHFPNDSNDYKVMFEALERNRAEIKVSMRKKWQISEAPALQMALMKLICTDDERKKISMNHIDHTTNNESLNMTKEERKAKIQELRDKANKAFENENNGSESE